MDFTLGVEEEYQVIDPETRELKSHDQKIVEGANQVIEDLAKAEMHQAVVEVGTPVCADAAPSMASSCWRSASIIESGASSQRRVLPSMSVNRKVTTPPGRSAIPRLKPIAVREC